MTRAADFARNEPAPRAANFRYPIERNETIERDGRFGTARKRPAVAGRFRPENAGRRHGRRPCLPYAPPPAYSYVAGEPYPAGYAMNPYYAGAGPVVPYRERAYYHHHYPRYAGPVGPYRPYPRYPHRPLGVRY
jgi:hypothetical protein